jgi:hypothetical protein
MSGTRRKCRDCGFYGGGHHPKCKAAGVSLTIAPCDDTEPHEAHTWTPEPRVIHNPRRCVGVPTADEACDRLHGLDGHLGAVVIEGAS